MTGQGHQGGKGFGSMDEQKQKEATSKGGQAAHEKGTQQGQHQSKHGGQQQGQHGGQHQGAGAGGFENMSEEERKEAAKKGGKH